tara:strand:- start:2055 stop:2336 length:282 start_codon:yes stop_codon:yes gene_type:complete
VRFAKWLYHLSLTDQLIILGFFVFSIGLSYLTIISLRFWHHKIHYKAEYSHHIRITPFFLLGVALIYASILYMTIGASVTKWIMAIANNQPAL